MYSHLKNSYTYKAYMRHFVSVVYNLKYTTLSTLPHLDPTVFKISITYLLSYLLYNFLYIKISCTPINYFCLSEISLSLTSVHSQNIPKHLLRQAVTMLYSGSYTITFLYENNNLCGLQEE